MIYFERFVTNVLDLFGVIELSGAGAGAEQIAVAPATAYVEIERVSYSGAGAGAIFSLYGGAATSANLRDGTISGSDRQFADESSLIRFAPGMPIWVGFTAGTASAAVPVWLQAVAVVYKAVDDSGLGQGPKVATGIKTPSGPTPAPVGWN